MKSLISSRRRVPARQALQMRDKWFREVLGCIEIQLATSMSPVAGNRCGEKLIRGRRGLRGEEPCRLKPVMTFHDGQLRFPTGPRIVNRNEKPENNKRGFGYVTKLSG